MKLIIKTISAYTLLLISSTCYGAQEEQGQKVTVSVSNIIDHGDDIPSVIYGNVYQTNAAGKVIEKGEKKYYAIQKNACMSFIRHKPTTLKQRATVYHRVIFATTKEALKDKVLKNKNSNDVDSITIKQSPTKNQESINECYWATPTTGKKAIKISWFAACPTACKTTEDASTPESINDIGN